MQVFISYAREDQKIAKRLYNDLIKRGIKAWLDCEELLVGQNWKYMISTAIKESSFFIALLSFNSISKRGFVQKELKIALDILDEFPPKQVFVLPVRIDACRPEHEKLESIHWADLFPSYNSGLNQILRVLKPEQNGPEELPERTRNKLLKPINEKFLDQLNLPALPKNQELEVFSKATQLNDIVLIKYLVKVRKYDIEDIRKALTGTVTTMEFWNKLAKLTGREIETIKSLAGGYSCDVNRDLNNARKAIGAKAQTANRLLHKIHRQLRDIVLIKYLVKVRKYDIELINRALTESVSAEDFWNKLAKFTVKGVEPIKYLAGGYSCDVNRDLNDARDILGLARYK